MNYITDQDYCRAKNQAGNTPLWKLYPLADRKVFPFHIFTNFHSIVSRGGLKITVRVKRIAPLMCGNCNLALDDWGNGRYYTAYIVFDSATEFYACCPDCKPEHSLEYEYQVHGYKEPMKLGIYQTSQKHRAIVYSGFSHSRLFNAWNYKNVTPKQLRDELGMDGLGGGSFDGGFLDYNHLHIKISDNHFKRLYEIKPAETVALANEIIAWNHAQKNNTPQIGIQTSLF
jgi:hypothetical protein